MVEKNFPVVLVKYSDDQPRAPAGESDGGQFTSGGGGGGASGGMGGPSNPNTRVSAVAEKLRALGVRSVTVQEGVVSARAADVLEHTLAVVQSLTSSNPLVATAVGNGPMGGALGIVIGPGKFVTHEDHEGVDKKALAFYNKRDHVITIASGLNTTNSAEKPSVGRGTHVVGTDFRTVLAHELGHAVSGKLAIAALKAGVPKVGAELFNSHPRDYWQKAVSNYAGTNPRELMAEAFAAYTHPGYDKGKALPSDLIAVFEGGGVKPNTRKVHRCCAAKVVRL